MIPGSVPSSWYPRIIVVASWCWSLLNIACGLDNPTDAPAKREHAELIEIIADWVSDDIRFEAS